MKRYVRESKGGYYCPTFLSMYIDSSENFENIFEGERLPEETEALFVHEYIHLLQDLTTLSGFSNICIVVDYLKWATNREKRGNIQVPLNPTLKDGYNLYLNAQLRKISTGQGKLKGLIKWKETKSILLKNEIITINEETQEVPLSLILNFIDADDKLHEYQIGEHCISESMAYLIENTLYKDVLPKPDDFPYNTVNVICDYLAPNLSQAPLKVIALCDACLMHSFPALALYNGLMSLSNKHMDMTPEEVFDFITGTNLLNLSGANGQTREELFRRYYSDVKNQMLSYFTVDFYDSMRKWVTQIFDDAYFLRTQNWHYMIDIARGKHIRENQTLKNTLDKIGCPVILNNQNILTYIRNDEVNFDVYPPVFNVINQIYSILNKTKLSANTYRCELIDWCKKDFKETNEKDLTTEGDACVYAPWERASFENGMNSCYFGQIWHSWGLKDIVPINESINN